VSFNVALVSANSVGENMRKKLLWLSLTISLILGVFSATIGITVAQETHDIAVVCVLLSTHYVELGETVDIRVIVENNGTESETFNVTVYYDNTAIETQTVQNLVAGANSSLAFTWNTTGVGGEIYNSTGHKKAYTIKAKASTVPGELNIKNNTFGQYVVVFAGCIKVVPQTTVDPNLTPGMNFTVSIYTDYNGTDITGWQFDLTYNPLVLRGIKVTNGDLITTEKHPTAMFLPGTFDNAKGVLSLTGAFFFFIYEPAPITSGPGTLANVTFEVVGIGDSPISLGMEISGPTKLIGYTEGGYGDPYHIIGPWEIPPQIKHGYFCNTVAPVIHDVAVVSVTPNLTRVAQGGLVNISVVVENQGTVPETFDVTAYYHVGHLEWPIGKKTVPSLAPGANVSLTFPWDTTGTVGACTISAKAKPVYGETDTEDNTLQSDKRVTVVLYSRELVVSLEAPDFLEPGNSSLLNATVCNNGANNETNVELQLLINGSLIDSTIVSLLPAGSSYTLTYLWTSTVETATYNITAYAPPLNGEIITVNNVATKLVRSYVSVHNIDTGLDYWTIQGAIDAPETLDGHTIRVDAGTYHEHVVVNKRVSLIGEDKRNTIIDGSGTGNVINVTANNVNITGFTIRSSDVPYGSGILLEGSSGNNISHNIITNNYFGIELEDVSNNTISSNTISYNNLGIFLGFSSSNTLTGNNVSNNKDMGILLLCSRNNTLAGNIASNNTHGIGRQGIGLGDSDNNVLTDNIALGNWVGIDISSSSNNVLANNTASNNGCVGISIYRSENHVLISNNVSKNGLDGIYLEDSRNNSLIANTVSKNEVGVSLSEARNNRLVVNIVTNNRYWGIYLVFSLNNSLIHNDVSENDVGIFLWRSRNNSLTRNNVTNNRSGVSLLGSHNNSLTGNSISKNDVGIELSRYSLWGILVWYSSNNLIFHNNFINNTRQVESDGSLNTWDDGYPSGGNYWSDYTGIDLYSGPYQNETGSDGIGDTPYIIDENSKDNYPLMKPWTPTPPTLIATADIVPNTLNLKNKGKWITCHIKLPEGYDIGDINVSTIQLNDEVPAESSEVSGKILMVKFDRSKVTSLCQAGEAELTVTGTLFDGTLFKCSDTIRVR